MRVHRGVLLQSILAIHWIATNAQAPSFSLEGRDPGVERWISYEILGPSNHPYPIIYLATHPFKTRTPELLTLLSETKFDAVSELTQGWIHRDGCPGSFPNSNDVWYSVKLSRHDAAPIQYCILPQIVACDYLNAVAAQVHASWTRAELRSVEIFMEAVHCDAKAAQREAGSDGR